MASEPFIYTGQWRYDIPRTVTHVILDPSVKKISIDAFRKCTQLMHVELCDGLERIGDGASLAAHHLRASASHPPLELLAITHFAGAHS